MAVGDSDNQIDSVMKEKRLFAPPKEFAQRANQIARRVSGALGPGRRRPARILGRPSPRRTALVQAVRQGPRLERAVRRVVRRRQDERLLQLPRRAPRRGRGQPHRHPLGRRAGRHAHAHLSPSCIAKSASSPTCSSSSASKQGDRRLDLHADGAGAGHRDARLRADRRDPLA